MGRICSLDGPATESTGGECSTRWHSGFTSVLIIASHLQAAEKRVPELTRPEAAVCDGLGSIRSENDSRRIEAFHHNALALRFGFSLVRFIQFILLRPEK
jgi:hypothetical protein